MDILCELHQKRDVETGLYYCNARYYNTYWCRWISPDSIEYLDSQSINGLNLYAYCNNDPVNYLDLDGHEPTTIIMIAVLMALITTALVVTTSEHPLFESKVTTDDFLDPIIMSMDDRGFKFIVFSLPSSKKEWILSELSVIYAQMPNFSISLGFPLVPESKLSDFIDIHISSGNIGFENRYVNFDFGIGISIDKKMKIEPFSYAIYFGNILEDLNKLVAYFEKK